MNDFVYTYKIRRVDIHIEYSLLIKYTIVRIPLALTSRSASPYAYASCSEYLVNENLSFLLRLICYYYQELLKNLFQLTTK